LDVDKLLADGGHVIPEPRPPKVDLTFKEVLSSAVSRVVLGCILLLAFLIGFWVGGAALHDPDTCWLLALGRYILEHGAIPVIDPFSWTFAAQEAAGRKFILYQWLSEVLFYGSTLPAGLVTLLMLVGTVMVTAFLSLPINIAVKRQSPLLPALGAVLLGIAASSFHFLARPEIFSCLFLAIALQLIHHGRVLAFKGEKVFPFTFVIVPIMVLWANMHTGFINGLSLLLSTTVATAVGLGIAALLGLKPNADTGTELDSSGQASENSQMAGDSSKVGHLENSVSQESLCDAAKAQKSTNSNELAFFKQIVLALVLGTLATLLNPYGFGLWVYIPDLFFNPINRYIQELKPVNLLAKEAVIFYPFVALSAWSFLQLGINFLALLKARAAKRLERRQVVEFTISVFTVVIASICGFKARRLITFTSLFLVAELCAMLGMVSLPQEDKAPTSEEVKKLPLLACIESHILDLWKTGGVFEPAIICFCAIAGVSLVTARIVHPELPASSVAFQSPVKAVAYLKEIRTRDSQAEEKKWPTRLFNDQQYGDAIIWHLNARPKVFIDTRFDMYGEKLVEDYRTIENTLPGWEKLLANYNFDCIFVRVKSPMVAKLAADKHWQVAFKDDVAVILRHVD
jgi:hypothetical protein